MEKITRALEAMVGGDLDRQLPVSPAGDHLDAISYSVNILVGELAFATANVRRAQAEAEAANAAKSKFLRTASHELRTPLAVIVWLTELLRDPDARAARAVRPLAGRHPPQRRGAAAHDGGRPRFCRASTTRTRRAERRSRRRRRDRARGAGEPAAARRTEADRHAARDRGRGVPATRDDERPALPPDRRESRGQRDQVHRAGRGRRARAARPTARSRSTSRTRASASRQARGAHLRAVLPGRPGGRRSKLGGSGVGLAIAKRFAEKLGGDVRLLASREGEGSTFRFTLPLDTASGVVEVAVEGGQPRRCLPVRGAPARGAARSRRRRRGADAGRAVQAAGDRGRDRSGAPPTASRRWRRRWRRTSRSS